MKRIIAAMLMLVMMFAFVGCEAVERVEDAVESVGDVVEDAFDD